MHVQLDTRELPDAIMIDYDISGHTSDGTTVRGTFSVMRPPDLPTKEKHERIDDPLLVAKIKAARDILKQKFVTDDDLRRLEREGAFRHLVVEQQTPSTLSRPEEPEPPSTGLLGPHGPAEPVQQPAKPSVRIGSNR